MQIRKIQVDLIRSEVVKPYIMAIEKSGMTESRSVLLRMETDEGLTGVAESTPHAGFTTESPASVMALIHGHLGPALLGMDPTNINALLMRMDGVVPGNPFAKALFDIAAYDIWGQSLNLPVYQLLGGKVRDRIPMIWPFGGGTPAENVAEATAKIADGYGSLHIKLGALSPAEDVARVAAVREAVGPHIPIMLDANQGWDRSTAMHTIRQLAAYNPSMVEQPVPAWDVESMARIQAGTHVPISADEVIDSPHKAIELIRRDAARVFSLKHGKMGGLTRTMQIAAIAEAAGIPCFVNSMIELGVSVTISLHLAAAVPNLINHGHALMSNLRMKGDILVPGSFQYDGKDILVPEHCAGLGIQLDEDEVARRTLDSFVLEL